LISEKISRKTSVPVEKLRHLHDQAVEYLDPINAGDQRLSLLIIERLVLDKIGHKITVRFGKNGWSGEKCSVCEAPLTAEGQALRLISRWENSAVMLCLCETHARESFEVDVDVITGALKSEVGHP
jgi:hypothetical protein